jgi:hypothetical protein
VSAAAWALLTESEAAEIRADVLHDVADTVRAAAPKYLDHDIDVHTFEVLNDLAAKIARGDL